MQKRLVITFVLVGFALLSSVVHAGFWDVKKDKKEPLVLMLLIVSGEDASMRNAMEAALVEGLQQRYEVFSGEQVTKKAKEIFLKESQRSATSKKDCDETRCMQDIAILPMAGVTLIEVALSAFA